MGKATKRTILVVEDNELMQEILSSAFDDTEFVTIVAKDAKQAKSFITSHCPDVVLLDLGLPDVDGIEVLKWVREWSNVPILVVSARNSAEEKAMALDLGADDYVTKPFSLVEIAARVRTAFRHADASSLKKPLEENIVRVKDLTVDISRRRVTKGEQDIKLTGIEYRIIFLLAKNVGNVLTYDEIMKEIWGPYYCGDNRILRVNMANIRKKLGESKHEATYISTENGMGYRMLDR